MRIRFDLVAATLLTMGVASEVRAQNTYAWNAASAVGGTGGAGTAWIRNGGTAINWTGGPANTIPGVTSNTSVTVNGNANDVATFNLSATLNSAIGMSNSTGNGNTGNGAANGLLSVGAIANTSTTANTVNFSASSVAVTPPGILQLNGAYSGNTAGLSTTTLVSATGGDVTFTRGTTNLLDVRLGIDGGAIIASAGRTVTFTSFLTDGGSARGFVKEGAGTLLFNGTNSNTGNNSVNAGTLGGTGTLTGLTTVAAGGTIEAGSAGLGTLNFNNNLTIQSGGTVRAQLGSGTGTGVSDTLNLSGGSGPNTLSLASGSNLTLINSGVNATGLTTFTLANLGPSGVLLFDNNPFPQNTDLISFSQSGTFGGLNVTLVGFSTGDQFTLRRTTDSVVLLFTPVPEPATMLAVCGLAVGGAAAVRRLRRKQPDVTPAA